MPGRVEETGFGRPTFDGGYIALYVDLSRSKQTQGQRIAPVFHLENPGGKRGGRVVRGDRHRRLDDDGAVVQFRADDVHRAAADLHAGIERFTMGVQAGEGGKQGGVNVEDPIPPILGEFLAKEAHETGQADDLDACLL